MTRVLIADDDGLVLEALGAYLRATGYAVDTARSGREALERAAVHPPDVLVCDYSFHEPPDGATVARQLLDALPRLTVFLVTGHSAAGIRATADALPRTELLTKPLDLFEFEARLDELTAEGVAS